MIPRFGTASIEKVFKIFVFKIKVFKVLYSFITKRSFWFSVIWSFHLTLFEKSDFPTPLNFLLLLRFLISRFSKYGILALRRIITQIFIYLL